MDKTVKKSIHKENLDFTIFQHIAQGSYPSKIAKDLNISKQRVDYYIASLKDRNLIAMQGQGVWIALQNYKPRKSKKLTRVAKIYQEKDFDSFDSDTIRGHAFQFKLEIPKNLKNWNNEKREKALNYLRIKWTPLKHLFGGGQKLIIRRKKVHLTNKSIIIYDKASYFAETSSKSQSIAMIKILYLIKALERQMRANFSINGKYKLRITRQHYSLIKNTLAMIYNKPERKKLEVYDEKGLWLLIDNSWNLNELECVFPQTSVEDSQGMKGWMNSMKKTDFKVTPEYNLEVFNKIAQIQQREAEKWGEYARDIVEHKEAIKTLGKQMEEFVKGVKELREEVKNLNKQKFK